MKRILPILMVLLMLACSVTEPMVEEPTEAPTVDVEEITVGQGGLSDPAVVVTPMPTPEPTEAPTDTPSPSPTPDGLLGGRFPDKFSDTTVKEERSYHSKNLSIEITRYENKGVYGGQLVYFVVDIYLQDVTMIRTEAARGDFTKSYTRTVLDMATDAGALVAINGDVYYRKRVDIIIRNGITYRRRNENDNDLCVLYRDGRMETFASGTYKTQDILDKDPWQVWSFGPELIDKDGNPYTVFPKNSHRMIYEQPRTAVGYYEPGHYCWVVVDGRQPGYSDGITLANLAKLMKDLGCTAAYNMDGGGSSVLYWDGDIIDQGCNEARTVTDIIYILPKE